MLEKQSLADLGRLRSEAAATGQEPEGQARPEPKLDAQGRAYATGRRKDAVARVWLVRGSGRILVKRGAAHRPGASGISRARPVKSATKPPVTAATRSAEPAAPRAKREEYRNLQTYFARSVLQMIVLQPFAAIDQLGQYDVMCTVTGGGLSGQAGAVRHGISRALTYYDPGLRPALKAGGFLTRDDREVERKKYGRAKARRSFQFSKR